LKKEKIKNKKQIKEKLINQKYKEHVKTDKTNKHK